MHLIMDVISTGFRGLAPIHKEAKSIQYQNCLKNGHHSEIIFGTDDHHNAISITNDGELGLIYIILMPNFDRQKRALSVTEGSFHRSRYCCLSVQFTCGETETDLSGQDVSEDR